MSGACGTNEKKTNEFKYFERKTLKEDKNLQKRILNNSVGGMSTGFYWLGIFSSGWILGIG